MPFNVVAVVGGINMDISGTPYADLAKRESNPGRIAFSPGGVGRNIAENLARLGVSVELISALGGDEFALMHERRCSGCGIGLNFAKRIPDGRSDIYLCVNDHSGDMRLAVSDMDLCKEITPVYLASCIEFINSCALLVADANIPSDSLEYLAKNVSVPLFLDPVSAAKAVKVKEFIGSFHTVKPNRAEAGVLTGCKAKDNNGYRRAAEALLAKGVRRVFISLGPEGIFYSDGISEGISPSKANKVVNTTGAGDAATAALAWAALKGFTAEQCAAAACRASAITVGCEAAVSEELREELLYL
jgi:pseudouridine kinase